MAFKKVASKKIAPKGKFKRRTVKKAPVVKEEEKPLKKSMLMNSAVVTVRDPSKKAENFCKTLRKILSPECLNKMEINPKMQDLADCAHQLLVKQIIYISENVIKIATLPNGPTYSFEIISFDNSFKNFTSDLYRTVPFLTFEGKSPLKQVFLQFGKSAQDSDADFKRVLHFHFKSGMIYIRHFFKTVEDTDDNFKVHLKEIGPKITLKLLEKVEGVLPELKIKLKFRNKFANNDDED
jgi:rRNA maturation protein Rpf1